MNYYEYVQSHTQSAKKTQWNFGNFRDSTDEENYEYAISPSHARIRCLVFLLKLVYTIPNKNEENTS